MTCFPFIHLKEKCVINSAFILKIIAVTIMQIRMIIKLMFCTNMFAKINRAGFRVLGF